MGSISHSTDPPSMNLLTAGQLDFELTNRQEHMLAQMSPSISTSELCYSRQPHASSSLLLKPSHFTADGHCNYILASGSAQQSLPDVFGDSDEEEDEDDRAYEEKILSTKRRRLSRDDAHKNVPDFISNANDDMVEQAHECDQEDPFADPDPEAYHRLRVYEWTWYPPTSSSLPSISLTPPDNDDYQTVLSLCHANHTPIQDSCFSMRLTVPTYVVLNNLPCGIPRGLSKEQYETEYGLEEAEVPSFEVQKDIGVRGLLLSEVWRPCSAFDEDEEELLVGDDESDVPSLDSSGSSTPISSSSSPPMQHLELAPCNSVSSWEVPSKGGNEPVAAKLCSAFDDDDDDDFFSQDPTEWFNAPSRF
ncbi:hypothetical protein FRC02_009994 [Tulasnella sp. 418]|nr:hypothetical protein FRC02_009994 [Tulasnella sp. 418]